MTVAISPPKTYTAAEYLALEVESAVRSEFRNGNRVEMSSGTPTHNEITGMLIFLLSLALRRQPYSIFVLDQRLWIPDANLYTYPDVMVTRRSPKLQPEGSERRLEKSLQTLHSPPCPPSLEGSEVQSPPNLGDLGGVCNGFDTSQTTSDTVMNPMMIAETLSKSTQSYDRGDKFAAYRTIETLQDYVLIDQYRPQVEHYVKQAENQWLLTTYSGLDATFTLDSVGVEIALAELYEAVEFE